MGKMIYKELNVVLSSYTGLIAILAFYGIVTLFLWILPGQTYLDYGYADPDIFFQMSSFVLLFILPLLSVGFFSQELKNGTIDTLRVLPTSMWSITLAKFWAALLFALLVLLLSVPILTVLNSIVPDVPLDYQALLGSYIGLFMLCACYIAISLFCSVITQEIAISVILAVVLGFFFFYGFDYFAELIGVDDAMAYGIRSLGFSARSETLSKGIVELSTVVYLASVCIFFLACTSVFLERKLKSL